MKKYRYIPGAVLLALSLIGMMTEGVPEWLSFILLIAAAVSVVFASRGMLSYSKAVKAINSGDYAKKQEGVRLMEKAVDAGLPDESAVVAASVLLQNGREDKGKELLESLAKSTNRKVSGPALASLSMYYWMTGEYGRAIELCEKAKSDGYSSRNLYINLLTYYLAAGKTREFSDLLEEMGTSGAAAPAIVDFHAVNEMLRGDWRQAGTFLEALCTEARPGFPDPYIHFAQVHMHYGNIGKAKEMLTEALDADYARYSVYKKETVAEMLRILSDSHECVPFVEAANRDNKAILKIVNGTLPRYERSEEECTLSQLPGYPEEPVFSEVLKEAVEEDDDDRDANTELTEADERWLRRHQS